MITRKDKEEVVKNLEKKIKKARLLVLTDFSGSKTVELEKLRSELQEKKVDFIVVKKTLMKRAGFETFYEGPVALAIASDDEVSSSKVLYQFAKNHKSFKIIEGVLDGERIDLTRIEELAKLPTREELIGILIAYLRNNTNKLILILKQHAGRKEVKS